MNETSADLARQRLRRSRNTLIEADALIEKSQYHGAVKLKSKPEPNIRA